MKRLSIVALAIVAGGCSLVKLTSKPACKAPTAEQSAQIVLTDPATFQSVGREYTRLHPCMVQQLPSGQLVAFYGGERPVTLPVSGVKISDNPKSRTAPIIGDTSSESYEGGSPLLDVDISAIQDENDSTDYWKQVSARKDGQLTVKDSTIAGCVQWIVYLSLAIVVMGIAFFFYVKSLKI